jgi:hypothetical protein
MARPLPAADLHQALTVFGVTGKSDKMLQFPHFAMRNDAKSKVAVIASARERVHLIPSFRGDAKHRTRNLEIPGP